MKSILMLSLIVSGLGFCNPSDPTVISGTAAFSAQGNALQIATQDHTIIQWKDFSIAGGESVHFSQLRSDSAVLNRVVGSEMSQLHGTLSSNGQVFLINPNGILIGKDGIIDTQGFFASTLDLSNEQFLSQGGLHFQGTSDQPVVNLGTITSKSGDIFLIGAHIANQGTIDSESGCVGLGQGSHVYLAPQGDNRLMIKAGVDGLIDDSGKISGHKIELKASNPYALAIKEQGVLEARALQERNGRIWLVAEEGSISASGVVTASGGEVYVLAEDIAIESEASFNVSGPQGGVMLIGGDERGNNPEIRNAKRLTVSEESCFHADGLSGDGGKIIFYATDKTHVYGTLHAKALGEQGDGGFIEVSAKSNDYQCAMGKVSTVSKHGKFGTFLIDPVDVTISAGPVSGDPFPVGAPYNYNPTVSSVILNTDVQNALNANNVTIDSTGGAGGNGDVIFLANITWANPTNFTVNAARTINIGTSQITSTYDLGGTIAHINFNALGTVSGDYHGIYIQGPSNGTGGLISTGSGNINLNGMSGDGSGSGSNHGINHQGRIETISGMTTLTGTSRSSGSGNAGILVDNATGVGAGGGQVLVTLNGQMTLNGTDSATGMDNCRGILLGRGALIRHGRTNSTILNGTTQSLGQNGAAVELVDSAIVQNTNTGPITINATASSLASSQSRGLLVTNSFIQAQFGIGSITITANSRGTEPNCYAVGIDSASQAIASGNLTINATVDSGGSNSKAVYIAGASQVEGGAVNIGATNNAPSGSGQSGFYISDSSSQVIGRSDTLAITGVGGGDGTGDVGIHITNFGLVQNFANDLTLNGTGGSGSQNEVGVLVDSGGRIASSGTINILGTGGTSTLLGASLGGNHGISVLNGYEAIYNLAGSASLTGIGGTSLGMNHGISLDTASMSIGQGLTMNGTGAGPSTLETEVQAQSNIGIKLNAVEINSLGITSITGTGGYSFGGTNYGIQAINSIISAGGSTGVQTLLMGTAVQGNGSDGIYFSNSRFNAAAAFSIPTQITAISHSNGTGVEGLSLNDSSIITSNSPLTIDGTGGVGSTGVQQSPGVSIFNSTVTGNAALIINATARNTVGNFYAFEGKVATVQSLTDSLNINAIDGDFVDTGVGGSEYKAFGAAVNIATANGSIARGGHISFQSTPGVSRVTNTTGQVNLTTVGALKDIVMKTSGEILTAGGNANLTAVRNIKLGWIDVDTGATPGDIFCTASEGSITNETGSTTAPPNLQGNQATLSAFSGIGLGTSNSNTAIGTNLTRLDSTLTAAGNIVIYEQDALTLGTITTVNGGFDLDAGGLIDQASGTVITTAGVNAFTYFTTSRATTLGTASITNAQASTLGQSILAGDYTFVTSPASSMTIDGLVKVGRDLSLTSSSLTVNVSPELGGSFTNNGVPIPPATGTGNMITAFGAGPDFDISVAALATTGDITIDLRNSQDVADPLLLSNAVILNNNNLMGGQIRVTTVDTFKPPAPPRDYNLIQTSPLVLQAGQNLIIRAARGAASGAITNPANPFPSPYGSSTLNTNNGSLITLTNTSNSIPGYVRIQDSYTTRVTSSNVNPLNLEHVNTYGDFTAVASAPIAVGLNSRSVRSNATLPATATVTLDAGTDTITIMSNGINPTVSAVMPAGAANGTVLYTSGSISGDGITEGNNVMINSSGMIGTSIINRLQIDASSIVFASNSSAYLGMLQGATIAGESLGGPIDLLTTVVGNLDLNTVTIGALTKSGLVTTGLGNGITAATTNGSLTVNEIVTTGTGNGAISLRASGGLETVNQGIISSGGAITLTADTGLIHSVSGDVATFGSGTIVATVSGGDITMADSVGYITLGGNITLTSSGNISLGILDNGAADIRLTATGGAITNALSAGVNLRGGRSWATSANGFGTIANPITMDIEELESHVTGTGGIFASVSNGISLTNWEGVSPGISTNNGSISIATMNGDQRVETGVTVGGAPNTLSLTAASGSIVMVPGTVATTAGGNVTLSANANIALSQVNVGSGDVSATAANGTIINNTGSLTTPNLLATTATLMSALGTGSGLPTSNTAISTTITNLTATANSGPIVIRETNQINLNNIVASNGNVLIDAGGLVQQNSGTTLDITGQLFIETSRDNSIGTVTFLNNQQTFLGNSIIGGNWIVTTSPLQTLELTNSSVVGGDFAFTCAGNLVFNGYAVSQGGTGTINNVDPDLLGPTINAKGPGPNFDISLANLGADPALLVNLRGKSNQFGSPPVTPAAITVGNAGNRVTSDARFITVDPQFNGSVDQDYNLVQSAPLTIGAGQTLTIAAARGGNNPPVSGANASPWGSSALNGSLGSNITLVPSSGFNTINGTLVIQDPNLVQITNSSDLNIAHANNYGNLTLISTAGGINTGVVAGQTVRSAGAQIVFTAQNGINIGESVLAIDKNSGNSLGEIIYTSNSGSITGGPANYSQGSGISFITPLGSLGTGAQSLNTSAARLIFSSRDSSYLINNNAGVSIAGEVTNGLLNFSQNGTASDVTVQSTVVGSTTRNNLVATNGDLTLHNLVGGVTLNQNVSAQGNAITILADVGPIFQGGGIISTGNTGFTHLQSTSGISGVGPNSSVHTESLVINGINSNSGILSITNTLVSSNLTECTGMLINGPGSANTNRNIYFSQEGGASINFVGVMGNGTTTLLAAQSQANMRFSGNVAAGSHHISVSNKDTIIENVVIGSLGNATFICDQATPTAPGSSNFSSQGIFMIPTNNLAIYAASGPQAPTNVIVNPPNQVTLGGALTSLATWDTGKPQGLLSKYATSYSDGGPTHGPGFGTNYTPGNGVFGSFVIWYKYNPDALPPPDVLPSVAPSSVEINTSGILRLIDINALVDRRYFINDWLNGPYRLKDSLLFNHSCDAEKELEKEFVNTYQ